MKVCRCNKCNTLLFDENPSERSKEFTNEEVALWPVENMVQHNENGETIWACPHCLTDSYLTDLEDDEPKITINLELTPAQAQALFVLMMCEMEAIGFEGKELDDIQAVNGRIITQIKAQKPDADKDYF